MRHVIKNVKRFFILEKQ